MAELASTADKFQPSSSRLLLHWPPPGAYLQQLSFCCCWHFLVSVVFHGFVAHGSSVGLSQNVAGTTICLEPVPVANPKNWTTPSLNSTGSGTQIPSHQRNRFTHEHSHKHTHTPINPHLCGRQSRSIFQPWHRFLRRGQRDKFRRSEISQNWDHSSSFFLLSSMGRPSDSDLTARLSKPTVENRNRFTIAFFPNLTPGGTNSGHG